MTRLVELFILINASLGIAAFFGARAALRRITRGVWRKKNIEPPKEEAWTSESPSESSKHLHP